MNNNFDKIFAEDLASYIWDGFCERLDRFNSSCTEESKLVLNVDAKNDFFAGFTNRYEYIITSYMDETVTRLDRHKVAAIAIIALLKANAITESAIRVKETEIFIAKHLLIVQVGLAHMQFVLNKELEIRNYKPIKEWYIPTLISCPDNSYVYVLARNLYYTE